MEITIGGQLLCKAVKVIIKVHLIIIYVLKEYSEMGFELD